MTCPLCHKEPCGCVPELSEVIAAFAKTGRCPDATIQRAANAWAADRAELAALRDRLPELVAAALMVNGQGKRAFRLGLLDRQYHSLGMWDSKTVASVVRECINKAEARAGK